MVWSVGAGLEERGVIVTGATGGIGQTVARAFASAGARVMIVGRNEDGLKDLLSTLDGSGHRFAVADLSDLSVHTDLIKRTVKEIGNLYVVAHLAAVLRRRNDLKDVAEEDWDVQLDMNLKSAFFFCRAATVPMIDEGKGGRIITYTSQGWWTGGFRGSVVYAASKGGVVSMTRGLARSLGPHGITVNCVSPGQVRTPMLLDGLREGVLEQMTALTPLGRIAEPEELAGVTVFLASQHASFITGATINVSGGFIMY